MDDDLMDAFFHVSFGGMDPIVLVVPCINGPFSVHWRLSENGIWPVIRTEKLSIHTPGAAFRREVVLRYYVLGRGTCANDRISDNNA
jgi:hypothetical protein